MGAGQRVYSVQEDCGVGVDVFGLHMLACQDGNLALTFRCRTLKMADVERSLKIQDSAAQNLSGMRGCIGVGDSGPGFRSVPAVCSTSCCA